MTREPTGSVLATLAGHNAWANELIFAACSEVDSLRMADVDGGYDSVIGILNHMVQVENAFFELAHGRAPSWVAIEDVAALRDECARIDRSYVEYARDLESAGAMEGGFIVPWFGFEIDRSEGVLQPLTHSHKHRADVSMLLPGLGGAGVEMDLIQWLDESRGGES